MGPLPDDLGVAHGAGGAADDAELVVADLVAVAVGAVQDVTCPPIGKAGDVGELVPEPGGDQQPAGADAAALGEQHPEAVPAVGNDVGDGAVQEVTAVPGDLVTPGREQLRGGHPVTRKEAVHVCRRGVAWRAVVDHDDVAAGPRQDQSRGETGGATADDGYVEGGHDTSVDPMAHRSNPCCRCRETAVQ
jgi:hypothetical protein